MAANASAITRKLSRLGGSQAVTLPPVILKHMSLEESIQTDSEAQPMISFQLMDDGSVRMSNASAPKRLRIPSLKAMLKGKTAADFKRLHSPLADRQITPEDLGTPAAAHRPDLVSVIESPAGGKTMKMTRTKLLSGRVRSKKAGT